MVDITPTLGFNETEFMPVLISQFIARPVLRLTALVQVVMIVACACALVFQAASGGPAGGIARQNLLTQRAPRAVAPGNGIPEPARLAGTRLELPAAAEDAVRTARVE